MRDMYPCIMSQFGSAMSMTGRVSSICSVAQKQTAVKSMNGLEWKSGLERERCDEGRVRLEQGCVEI